MVRDTVSYLARAGPPGLRRLRALLRRLPRQPRVREGRRTGRARGRRRPWWCSATPTAACCPRRSRPSSRTVLADTGARLGIHAQDDTGCAVANTLAAVDAGATHVQCTANGYGERVGNSNLFPVVAALELKYGRKVLPEGALARDDPDLARHRRGRQPDPVHPPALRRRLRLRAQGRPARLRDQGRPRPLPAHRPRAGRQHHADAGLRHGRPRLDRAQGQGTRHRPRRRPRAGRPGGRPGQGARAQGLHLRGRRRLLRTAAARRGRGPARCSTSEVESWRAIVEDRPDGSHANEATVKLWAKGERIVATAEGNGPVNALDRALRVALEKIYPQLAKLELVDYKVRILEGVHGTQSTTRVLISTSDGGGRVVDGRRRGERDRRVLAGAGGRVRLRAAAGRGGAGEVGPPLGVVPTRRPAGRLDGLRACRWSCGASAVRFPSRPEGRSCEEQSCSSPPPY